jgi:DNA (cytosine-5)-methyltransferase 1
MRAYYNENDPKAAAWLRELIRAGHIADGDVDERSILDVTPMDVAGYTQCHFFAGIGGWSYALRLAGWSDARRVWTGSCPCQPFSDAGKGAGFADVRHLWPVWAHLIRIVKPPVIFGEQVASKAGLEWFDLVHSDLEDADYAVGAFDLCAAGVGAPHIRQRLYFVADSSSARLEERRLELTRQEQPTAERGGEACDLAKSGSQQRDGDWHERTRHGQSADDCELGDAGGGGSWRLGARVLTEEGSPEWCLRRELDLVKSASISSELEHTARNGRLEWRTESGRWSTVGGCEFIPCTDGKARPIEPGTFPLAHGVPHRVGLLRGYGNAIVAPLAADFIAAYADTRGLLR